MKTNIRYIYFIYIYIKLYIILLYNIAIYDVLGLEPMFNDAPRVQEFLGVLLIVEDVLLHACMRGSFSLKRKERSIEVPAIQSR